MYKYSASTGGFYVPGIHAVIPEDAVDVSQDEHTALLAAQATGKNIQPDADGRPTAITLTTSLADAQATMRAAINAGFDAAITASLTMPSASTPPSAYAVYTALEEWKAEDPEGFAALLAIHTARRDELLAAVAAATTTADVQAIVVSYAV